MKSQSPSNRIPRLNHSSSFPCVTVRKPQLPRQTTSELLLPNGAIHVDKIAAQTQYYLTVLEEHLDAIRDHPQRPDACERLLKKRGAPHPQQLTSYTERHKLRMKMENLIQHGATTVDEHLIICCAANTLLLLQEDIISSLPDYKRREINRKVELISTRRNLKPAEHTQPTTLQFGPFVPKFGPVLERPKYFQQYDIAESLDSLLSLSSLPKIIGAQFLLKDIDLLFCIGAIHLRPDGTQFSIHYEDVLIPDVVDSEELRKMLQNSKRVL